MKYLTLNLLTLILLLYSPIIKAQEVITSGPENGSLVIVGGGQLDESIVQKFVELAGGAEAEIVVIPTAGGRDSYSDNAGGAALFRAAGAGSVEVIHTTDPKIADSEDFAAPLKTATAVWFSGGRQWRLVDAYSGTLTERMFWEILNRGGVIGGSSAGATIQGSYLARGDTRTNQIMMGDHEKGFGFLTNVAIDQHTLARNRHFDMFNILRNRPELLGLSIDESTAIVVDHDEFEVIGRSYVLVYDGTFWSREGSDMKDLPSSDELFYFLRSGDRYDLTNRRVID